MTPLEFTFQEPDLELALEQMMQSECFSAARFLTLMEGADEETFEDALQLLNDRHILPDLSDLPAPAGDGEAAVRLRREQQLVQAMARCTQEFERLPLVQDKEILNNVLYSGVWCGVRREKEEDGK